jgi:Kelch motif
MAIASLMSAACGARSDLASQGGLGSESGAPSTSVPSSDGGGAETVVLFGGMDEADNTLADTWVWDGSAWTERRVPSPPARWSSTFGSLGPLAVVFGGSAGLEAPIPLEDTWTWSGTRWDEHTAGPQLVPPAAGASIDGALVVYGVPFTENDGPGQTWQWDGASWSQAPGEGPAPDASWEASMASLNGTIVLFGGTMSGTGNALGATWTWDGGTWTMYTGIGPGPRSSASMATLGDTVVLFGGYVDNEGQTNETWTWDGTTWTPHVFSVEEGPPPRDSAGMATLNGRVVLFGGEDGGSLLDDTWTWDGSTWTEEHVQGPSARVACAMVTVGGP